MIYENCKRKEITDKIKAKPEHAILDPINNETPFFIMYIFFILKGS